MAYNPKRSTNHVLRGPTLLLDQFKGKPLFGALLVSYLKEIQGVENALWEIIDLRNLTDGRGVVLDWIGNLVGRLREGLSDDDYLMGLKAQIRINRTRGRPEDLIAVTRLSLPDGVVFTYDEAYPATAIIRVTDPVTFNVGILFRNLVKTKAGGVRLFLEYTTDPPEEVFLFSNYNPLDPDYTFDPLDTQHGLGWDDDPDMGGKLTMVEGT